jgi:hypothetical protein
LKPFLLAIAFCCLIPVANAAAIVTCTDGLGETVTVSNTACLIGTGNDTFSYFGSDSFVISGNSFRAQAFSFLNFAPYYIPESQPLNGALYPFKGSATWFDSFALPRGEP